MKTTWRRIYSGWQCTPDKGDGVVERAAGCTLVRLRNKSYRRIGYIRARRHLVSRPMREFTSWLRAIAKEESKEQHYA
jgi:hypothetical protein